MSTKPIRAVIADDEPLIRDSIRHLLKKHRDIEVVGEAADGNSTVELVKAKLPDLLLLDVRMPGLNGFDVLEAISGLHVPVVVFITAHDQYAVRAFDVPAFGYLLKPFTNDRFESVIARAKQQLRLVGALDAQRELISSLESRVPDSPGQEPGLERDAPVRRIAVHDGERVILLDLNQVDWIEAHRNYSVLHVGRRSYLVRTTLTGLSIKLDRNIFARVHRSAIVNLRRVKEVVPKGHSDYELVLQDGSLLKMSRKYRANLFSGAPGGLG